MKRARSKPDFWPSTCCGEARSRHKEEPIHPPSAGVQECDMSERTHGPQVWSSTLGRRAGMSSEESGHHPLRLLCGAVCYVAGGWSGGLFFRNEFFSVMAPSTTVRKSHPLTSILDPSDRVPASVHSDTP